jgi:rhodanese-related sulfurtransferase
LDENAEILMVERGPYVSYANCRLPYYCRSGQRAYYATRILLQNGFKARDISGGMMSRMILAQNV